jgi:hypothetical protein
MKIQQNSFNPSSNDLLVPKIQHLRAAVPRPEVLFVTRKKKKKKKKIYKLNGQIS